MGFLAMLKESIKYADETKSRKETPKEDMKICSECGHLGGEERYTKGSFAIELVLWLCAILPGLLYSLWRLSSKFHGCPQCQGRMIPASSPRGKVLLEEFQEKP